jgi:hypothetical protein
MFEKSSPDDRIFDAKFSSKHENGRMFTEIEFDKILETATEVRAWAFGRAKICKLKQTPAANAFAHAFEFHRAIQTTSHSVSKIVKGVRSFIVMDALRLGIQDYFDKFAEPQNPTETQAKVVCLTTDKQKLSITDIRCRLPKIGTALLAHPWPEDAEILDAWAVREPRRKYWVLRILCRYDGPCPPGYSEYGLDKKAAAAKIASTREERDKARPINKEGVQQIVATPLMTPEVQKHFEWFEEAYLAARDFGFQSRLKGRGSPNRGLRLPFHVHTLFKKVPDRFTDFTLDNIPNTLTLSGVRRGMENVKKKRLKNEGTLVDGEEITVFFAKPRQIKEDGCALHIPNIGEVPTDLLLSTGARVLKIDAFKQDGQWKLRVFYEGAAPTSIEDIM